MSNKFGDLLFSKSSWGSRELYTTFGFGNASKSSMNSVDAGKEILPFMIQQQGWINLPDALYELVSFIDNRSPTESYSHTIGDLTTIWNKQSALMRDETPNELAYYQSVVTSIKNDFNNVPTIGRNKLKESVIKHCLNLFQTI